MEYKLVVTADDIQRMFDEQRVNDLDYLFLEIAAKQLPKRNPLYIKVEINNKDVGGFSIMVRRSNRFLNMLWGLFRPMEDWAR